MSASKIPRRYDVARLVKTTRARGQLRGAFESLAAARTEARHRTKLLAGCSDPAATALATLLAECRKGHRCRSLACPVCSRIRRRRRAAAILSFLAAYRTADLVFVTIIDPKDARPAGQLNSLDPIKLVNRTRRRLERIGIDKATSFVVGSVDGEWDEGWGVYQPHLHAIAWGLDKSNLRPIAALCRNDSRVRVTVRVEPVTDLPRLVLYLDKAFWPAIARNQNPAGIYPHAKRRPTKAIEAEIMLWFHRNAEPHLHFLFGVKKYGASIAKT